jgi:hypothetical protein
MKKHIPFIVALFLMSNLLLLPSCFPDDPTVGTLAVQVVDYYTGVPLIGEKFFIATSYENLKKGDYYAITWTDQNGWAFFADLPPAVYYYDTATWEDWGAIQTYAGISQYAYLFVNDPHGKQNK